MKLRTVLLLVIGITPLFVFGANFTRTLLVGMHGEDVRELQKFLNTDHETRVANTGDGSPGSETDYFGSATKRALIKFQEKYREDVLAPVGLISGTGFFGEKTRAKMNALMSRTPASIATLPKIATTTPAEKGEVIVMFPSQYSGKPGTMITLSGAGFTATGNTIYFGDSHAVEKAVSWNGQDITFKIPNIPKEVYTLYVKNARGESNKDAFFVVTDGVTPEPKIDTVAPEHITRGSTVTLKGSGFARAGNTVQYGAGVSRNISSEDGTTLSFVVSKDIFTAITSPSTQKISLPVGAVVINENGVSGVKDFVLEL